MTGSAARAWIDACYWLGLTLWTAALVAAGVAAMNVFTRLPAIGVRMDSFDAVPVETHGRIAAGMVMQDVFFTVDLLQFAAAPIVLIAAGLQLFVGSRKRRRPSNIVRVICLIAAAAMLGYHATRLAPTMNADLRGYWSAAENGDLVEADRRQAAFATLHRRADLILRRNLGLLVVAITASAVALGPESGPGSERPPRLEQPRLTRTT